LDRAERDRVRGAAAGRAWEDAVDGDRARVELALREGRPEVERYARDLPRAEAHHVRLGGAGLLGGAGVEGVVAGAEAHELGALIEEGELGHDVRPAARAERLDVEALDEELHAVVAAHVVAADVVGAGVDGEADGVLTAAGGEEAASEEGGDDRCRA